MENHPFDRIDPQKNLQSANIFCPNCSKPLVSPRMEGNYVVYKCAADGKKFRLPVNQDTFNLYRQDLKRIYDSIDLSLDKWTKEVQKDYLEKLNKIAEKYNFTSNDHQFDLLKVAVFTRNFQVKYTKWNYGSVRAYTRYKSIKKSLDDSIEKNLDEYYYPLDQDGKILFDSIREWIPKPIPKWVKILIPCVVASAAIATTIAFAIMPKEITDSKTGVSATIDSKDYGAFGKWGVDFVVSEVEKSTPEYKTAEVLLKNESSKFVLYDLSMLSGSNYVQPNGSVRIEAPLPEGYSAANVKVYHVKPEDGSYEIVENQSVIASQNLVVFEVDHFSLFAIAEHPRNIKFQIEGASVPTQTLMIGELVSEPETPVREGYVFAGWYNGDKKWSFADDTVPSADLTLVGRWTAKEYNLTLDYADGSKEITSKIAYDQQYTLEIPKRVGYSFVGWFDEEGNQVSKSGIWKPSSDIKLTARWELNGYKITFDANGGSVSITEKDFTYGEKYGELPTPTRVGYSFDGWYTEKNGGREVVSTTTIIDAASHTLYAHWNELSYTVSFNSNGGTSVPTQIVKYNEKADAPDNVTRNGYYLVGWYKDVELTKVFDFNSEVITRNITLYAKWNRETITISFNSNGGEAVEKITINKGESLGRDLPNPTRVGYKFAGWYNGDRLVDSTTILTSSTTLTARWNDDVIIIESYWGEVITVDPLNTHLFWITEEKISQYYNQGYNKIDISYEFYTTGGWSLFGGNVNVHCYLSPTSNRDNNIHYKSVASSKSGKWIRGSKTADLVWFKNNNQVYLILNNENLSEEFTVSKLKITIKLYHE